jgi:hypothetical protein
MGITVAAVAAVVAVATACTQSTQLIMFDINVCIPTSVHIVDVLCVCKENMCCCTAALTVAVNRPVYTTYYISNATII